MAVAQKKAIVRRWDAGPVWGYLPQAGLRTDSAVHLMRTDGHIEPIALDSIKTISYVRDFNQDDSEDPERLGRKSFPGRPRGEGLWLRLTLRDGDVLEGLSPVDLGFLNLLAEDQGVLISPPDTRANTQRIFVPRRAIAAIAALGLVQPSTGRRPKATQTSGSSARSDRAAQPNLFGE